MPTGVFATKRLPSSSSTRAACTRPKWIHGLYMIRSSAEILSYDGWACFKEGDFPRVAELGVIAENAETRGKKRGNAEWQNPRVFRAFSAFSARFPRFPRLRKRARKTRKTRGKRADFAIGCLWDTRKLSFLGVISRSPWLLVTPELFQ